MTEAEIASKHVGGRKPVELPFNGFVRAHRVSGDMPRLPEALRGQVEAGVAQTHVCVDTTGRLTNITILQATPGVEDAVREALRTWHYLPFMQDNRVVPVCFQMGFILRPAN